jgi:hypothetical protein
MAKKTGFNNIYIIAIAIALIFTFIFRDFSFKNIFGNSKEVRIIDPIQAKQLVSAKAEVAIKALKFKNFTLLASITHPKKGVRFSPYPYILSSDIIIKAKKFQKEFDGNKIRKWGIEKHGVPMELSFKDYFSQYVYDQDYDNYDKINFNKNYGEINVMVDSSRKYYPQAIIVEYFVADNMLQIDKNWHSLKLVFERYKKKWVLSGIINIRSKY